MQFVMQVFELVDPELSVHWQQKDGDSIVKGAIFGEVRGRAQSILVAERIALNFMQRMSGIATATHQMVQAVQVGRPSPLMPLRQLKAWQIGGMEPVFNDKMRHAPLLLKGAELSEHNVKVLVRVLGCKPNDCIFNPCRRSKIL